MTSMLNLEEELQAGAEQPLNETRGAVGGTNTQVLDEALGSAGSQKVDQKMLALMKRSWSCANSGDKVKAARLALKALDLSPENGLANQLMAVILQEMGRLSKSLEFYQRAIKYAPNNPDLYNNLGHIAWKLDMLEGAEKFFRIQQQLQPDAPAASINLASILREQGRTSDAIEILRAAIYRLPENYELWNSLGTTLLDAGEPEQASTFYTEAIRLEPEFSRGYHNKAYALDLLGELDQAIPNFRRALELNESEKDYSSIQHGLSLAQLGNGELKEGWKNYAARLNKNYRGYVRFNVKSTYWDGDQSEDLKGKRILVIGEQGLGDELMHSSALLDLFQAVGKNGAVGLVCEERLIPMFKRSFPQLEFIGHHFTRTIEAIKNRYVLEAENEFKPDLWTTLGNLQRTFRTEQKHFPKTATLKADPDRLEELKKQVAALPEGLKVGFTWKSKVMTHSRVKYFSPLDAWKPVLKIPGITFVNMQYGDVEDDIAYCKKKFGITIHQIDGLDLHDDLDGVAALGCNLDLLIGQTNASIALTSCCGGKSWILNAGQKTWTQFGSGQMLWLPGSECYDPVSFRDWNGAIKNIAQDLQALTSSTRRGAA